MPATLPPNALAAIPDGVRFTIANALRAAADKWDAPSEAAPDGYAQTLANGRLADQFRRQAAEARELAAAFESCDDDEAAEPVNLLDAMRARGLR